MNLPPTKPIPPPPDTAINPECGHCASKDSRLFHRLWIRGMNRRVCTSCVLLLHPSSFCPSCFQFFDHPLSNTSSATAHRFLSCTKCSSLTHLNCLPSPPPSSPFLCPPCSQPNFSFFPDSTSPMDKRRALILLCACKVASAAATKSLALARARVERTVREAALARKRARDALDHCSILDKIKRLRLEGTFEVSNARNLGTHHNNVVCKKEELNSFTGQGKVNVKVPSEVPSLPRPVIKNGNNDSKLLNR
ncbi:hypothetical protein PHAVU_007G204700 [Phaseolus vulgaris]|uniref:Zinc finger PHD-type domain-containing protein n=1 Tax=Phaseolus vulgaris TaxID=3885 RepID=V7BJ40_PHAVU|nr:hypothetical protein PHAVU_007G204700g [Phaseolus vulgaris]ESW17033.1 hypothetical protein PHAVU_007G204700g [Phaseolus vulgaris]